MDKEILKILLSKNHLYVKVWCWLYANSDNDGIIVFDYKDIMQSCGVSKTIIFRALEMQSVWNKDGDKTMMLRKKDGNMITAYCTNPADIILDKLKQQNSEHLAPILKRLWNNNRLIIMFITEIRETVLKRYLASEGTAGFGEKQEKPEKSDKPVKSKREKKKKVEQEVADEFNEQNEISQNTQNTQNTQNDQNTEVNQGTTSTKRKKLIIDNKILKTSLAIYIQFYQNRNDGISPMINAHQVKSLKELIHHFMKNSPDPSEENIIHSLDILFNNWDKYPKYIQEQLKISQISSNITNIISYLRNNSKTIIRTKTTRLKDFQEAIIDKVNSGQMDGFLEGLGKN